MGTLTNLLFFFIIAASKELSKKLDKPNLMTLLSGALVSSGLILRCVNMSILLKINHSKKILFGVISNFVGLTFFYFSFFNDNFLLAFIGSIFVGFGKGMGQVTLMGYLKAFNPLSLGYFSSGVGFSGIFGSSLFIIFNSLGVEEKYYFGVFYPIYLIYYFLFRNLIKLTDTHKIEANINKD